MAKRDITSDGDLSAETYLHAADEHADAMYVLYHARFYPLAVYASGLCVECLLRAIRRRGGRPFTSDHHLEALSEDAGLVAPIPAERMDGYNAALGRLVAVWQNKHRFRSEAALRRFLKGRGLDRRIRGDYVKENARRAVESALVVYNVGRSAWLSQERNPQRR